MLFLNGEKKNKKPLKEKDINLVFKLAALLVMGFVVYEIYVIDEKPINKLEVGGDKILSEAQIQAKVEEAFERMSESPKFQKVNEFVDLINDADKSASPLMLDTKDGVILYLPKKSFEPEGLIKLENKEGIYNVSFEKLKRETD